MYDDNNTVFSGRTDQIPIGELQDDDGQFTHSHAETPEPADITNVTITN